MLIEEELDEVDEAVVVVPGEDEILVRVEDVEAEVSIEDDTELETDDDVVWILVVLLERLVTTVGARVTADVVA